MAADVTVAALKPFTYRQRRIRPGERVAMAPIDAAIHARRQDVSLSRLVGQPTPPDPEPPRRRRRYRRRDLVAED